MNVELADIQPKVSQDLPISPSGVDADKLMNGTPTALTKGQNSVAKTSLAVKVAKKLAVKKQRTKISPMTRLLVGSIFFWFGGLLIYVASLSLAAGGIFLVYDYADGFFFGILNTFLINRLITYEKKDNRSITYNDYFIYNIVIICTSTLLFPALNNFLRNNDTYLVSTKIMVIIGNLILNFVYFYNQKETNGSAAISDLKYTIIHGLLMLWAVMCCGGVGMMLGVDKYIQEGKTTESIGIIFAYYIVMEIFKHLMILIERKANTYMGESLVLLLTNMTISALVREALSVSYVSEGLSALIPALIMKCVIFKLLFLVVPAALFDVVKAKLFKDPERQRVTQKTAFGITMNMILLQASDLANMLVFPLYYLVCRAIGPGAITNTFQPWTTPDVSTIYVGFIIEFIFEAVLTLIIIAVWRFKRYLQNRRTSNAVFTLIRRNVCWLFVFNTCIYSYMSIEFKFVNQTL